jgi:hypothetical protein
MNKLLRVLLKRLQKFERPISVTVAERNLSVKVRVQCYTMLYWQCRSYAQTLARSLAILLDTSSYMAV